MLDIYKYSTIRGTSITLNDLQYIPNPTGHRLYMKPNLVKYDPTLNNKIYYRYTFFNFAFLHNYLIW